MVHFITFFYDRTEILGGIDDQHQWYVLYNPITIYVNQIHPSRVLLISKPLLKIFINIIQTNISQYGIQILYDYVLPSYQELNTPIDVFQLQPRLEVVQAPAPPKVQAPAKITPPKVQAPTPPPPPPKVQAPTPPPPPPKVQAPTPPLPKVQAPTPLPPKVQAPTAKIHCETNLVNWKQSDNTQWVCFYLGQLYSQIATTNNAIFVVGDDQKIPSFVQYGPNYKTIGKIAKYKMSSLSYSQYVYYGYLRRLNHWAEQDKEQLTFYLKEIQRLAGGGNEKSQKLLKLPGILLPIPIGTNQQGIQDLCQVASGAGYTHMRFICDVTADIMNIYENQEENSYPTQKEQNVMIRMADDRVTLAVYTFDQKKISLVKIYTDSIGTYDYIHYLMKWLYKQATGQELSPDWKNYKALFVLCQDGLVYAPVEDDINLMRNPIEFVDELQRIFYPVLNDREELIFPRTIRDAFFNPYHQKIHTIFKQIQQEYKIDEVIASGSFSTVNQNEEFINNILNGRLTMSPYDSAVDGGSFVASVWDPKARSKKALGFDIINDPFLNQPSQVVAIPLPTTSLPPKSPPPLPQSNWNELPQSKNTESKFQLDDILADKCKPFFSRQVYRDTRLKYIDCIETNHSLFDLDTKTNNILGSTYINNRLSSSSCSYTLFTIRIDNDPVFVFIDRKQELVFYFMPVEWLMNEANIGLKPQITHHFLRTYVLPNDFKDLILYPLNDPKLKLHQWSLFYFFLLNHRQHTFTEIIQAFMERDPSHSELFLKLADEEFPRRPFQNVPLANTRTKELLGKSGKYILFLEHLAWKTSLDHPGHFICFNYSQQYDKDPIQLVQDELIEKGKLYQYDKKNTYSPLLLQTIQDCKQRWVITPIAIYALKPVEETKNVSCQLKDDTCFRQGYQDGHANIVLIDKTNKIVYRFEPNGHDFWPWVDDLLEKEFLPLLPKGYSYENIQKCNANLGPQAIQKSENVESGYCVAWSLMFATLLFLNPDWSPQEIIDKMNQAGEDRVLKREERREKLLEYVQRFLQYVNEIIPHEAIQNPLVAYQMRLQGLLPPIGCSTERIQESLVQMEYVYYNKKTNTIVYITTKCGYILQPVKLITVQDQWLSDYPSRFKETQDLPIASTTNSFYVWNLANMKLKAMQTYTLLSGKIYDLEVTADKKVFTQDQYELAIPDQPFMDVALIHRKSKDREDIRIPIVQLGPLGSRDHPYILPSEVAVEKFLDQILDFQSHDLPHCFSSNYIRMIHMHNNQFVDLIWTDCNQILVTTEDLELKTFPNSQWIYQGNQQDYYRDIVLNTRKRIAYAKRYQIDVSAVERTGNGTEQYPYLIHPQDLRKKLNLLASQNPKHVNTACPPNEKWQDEGKKCIPYCSPSQLQIENQCRIIEKPSALFKSFHAQDLWITMKASDVYSFFGDVTSRLVLTFVEPPSTVKVKIQVKLELLDEFKSWQILDVSGKIKIPSTALSQWLHMMTLQPKLSDHSIYLYPEYQSLFPFVKQVTIDKESRSFIEDEMNEKWKTKIIWI